MEPKIAVTVNLQLLPFGVRQAQEVICPAPAGPVEAKEPTVVPPTTVVDHLITSPPVRIMRR